jgi:uncharacterized protein (TIGR03032 family)
MSRRSRAPAAPRALDALWAHQHARLRDPHDIVVQWDAAASPDPALFAARARGDWWDVLREAALTLVVTREYEHLVLGLSAGARGPHVTYVGLPHPSGVAVDRRRGLVHIASTRNPNQIYDFAPVRALEPRLDAAPVRLAGRPLVPVRSRFYPGSLYMHDLALIGGRLYANAVGQNAVVRLPDAGGYARAWWPRCIETPRGPLFGRNHLQLNSIAAGPTLRASYFSASTAVISSRRPGHRNFPVDRRGVIFSGATRAPIVRGLTRPHSARLHGGRLWVLNSGYGEFGVIDRGVFEPLARLPGWTRGLCLRGRLAFVATSRVIPRFHRYAPGLDVAGSVCAVHAVDIGSGRVLGSLTWPCGYQIFAVDWLDRRQSAGFPFSVRAKRTSTQTSGLFYGFLPAVRGTHERTR